MGLGIIQFGRLIINLFSNKQKHDDVSKSPAAADILNFIGSSDELTCWIPSTEPYTDEKCASAERINALLAENKELLTRYKSLYRLSGFNGMFVSGQYLINLNKLISAEIMLDLTRGDANSAYIKWRDNYLFVSRVLKQDGTMIDRAIFLMADGINLATLENILYQAPELSSLKFDELDDLLQANRLERYNLKGMLRAEYKYINNEMINTKYQSNTVNFNYIKNRLYRFHLDFLNRTQMPAVKLDENKSEMYAKYVFGNNIFKYDWLNPVHSILSNELISGQVNGFHLVKSMHSKDAYIKLLNLSIRIRQQKIAAHDIQKFLIDAGSDYYNPFTNKPMQWDAARKEIYFIEPSQDHRKIAVRL